MATRIPVIPAPPLPTREQWAAYVQGEIAKDPNFIPPQQVCLEDIGEWTAAKEELDRVKNKEIMLRKRLASFFFPAPTEGTNKVKLPDGSVVNLSHGITRDVDRVRLDALGRYTVGDQRSFLENSLKIDTTAWPDEMPLWHALKLDLQKLVEWDPKLVVKEYRELTEEQRAIFDGVLDIKPAATPQIKLEPPKAA